VITVINDDESFEFLAGYYAMHNNPNFKRSNAGVLEGGKYVTTGFLLPQE
jgi:hypothetical protein